MEQLTKAFRFPGLAFTIRTFGLATGAAAAVLLEEASFAANGSELSSPTSLAPPEFAAANRVGFDSMSRRLGHRLGVVAADPRVLTRFVALRKSKEFLAAATRNVATSLTLAKEASVGLAAVERSRALLKAAEDGLGTLEKFKRALEAAGLEFIYA